MKINIVLSILIVFLAQSARTQKWTQKTDLSGNPRKVSSAFAAADKGYVVLGEDSNGSLKELWEYDAISDTWSKKADFSGLARKEAFSFPINNEGYVGGGWDGITLLKDFFKYNPGTNSWTAITPYPGNGGRNGFSASVNGMGYAGGGGKPYTPYASDFWEYNPVTDAWTKKADFPFGSRASGVCFGLDNKIYICLGQDGSNDFKELWSFDPISNSWSQKADFPGYGRIHAACFILNGKAIVGGGFQLSTGTKYNDYYQYDPVSNSWMAVPTFANGQRITSVGFSVNNKGYITTGSDTTDNKLNDLWEFSLPTAIESVNNTMVNFRIYPTPSAGILTTEHSETGIIEIYNEAGKRILVQRLEGASGNETINMDKYPSGCYVYRFRSTNNDEVNDRILIVR